MPAEIAVVGLVYGTLSLFGLFKTAVSLLEDTDSGRTHGKDFEQSLMKVELLKARLHAWGYAVNVYEPGRELPALQNRWPLYQRAIGGALIGISSLFNDTDKLQNKYGVKSTPSHRQMALPPADELSTQTSIMQATFTANTVIRQRDSSFGQKTKWAIWDKKKFEGLHGQISNYLEGLESIAVSLNIADVREERLRREIERLSTPRNIALLAQVADEAPTPPEADETPALPEAGPEAADTTSQPSQSTSGHTVLRNIIRDRARFIQGNIGVDGPQASSRFEKNLVSDDSRVVVGNMSPDAFAAFMK